MFNQLVEQQTSFYADRLPEILDSKLDPARRTVLASAAYAQSHMLHGRGIGDAGAPTGWYSQLKSRVAANIKVLENLEVDRGHRH